MNKAQISVIGIGPGSPEDITPAALDAMKRCDVVVGYRYYFQFIQSFLPPGTDCIDTGMKREKARAEQAFDLAEQGKSVCVISSGDAGIYGMERTAHLSRETERSGKYRQGKSSDANHTARSWRCY